MFEKMSKALLVMAISAAFMTGPALAGPIVIKFSHVVAENTAKGLAANKFRDLVKEKMGDKVVVEVYPSSQLFDDDKVLEAMMLGDVQMAAPALSKFERYTKSLQLFDLPFLFQDMAAVERFQQSADGQKLLDSLSKKGFVGLGYLHNGLKQLSSSKPMRVPADAEGLKFRIMSSDVLAAQFNAMKAVPLKKPFSEVFILLQTRAIDGQENSWSNIYSQKYFEIQPYITESNHGLLDYMVVTSAEFWKGLPADIRTQLTALLNEAIAYGNKISGEKDIEDKQKIIDSKRTEIITLKPEERAQWVEVMKPVWKQFEGEIGKDLVDAAFKANQTK